jgi:hypothetical protein
LEIGRRNGPDPIRRAAPNPVATTPDPIAATPDPIITTADPIATTPNPIATTTTTTTILVRPAAG